MTLFIVCLAALLILLFIVIRLAVRWLIRLLLIGVILLIALAAGTIWWLNQGTTLQHDKSHLSPGRRATSH